MHSLKLFVILIILRQSSQQLSQNNSILKDDDEDVSTDDVHDLPVHLLRYEIKPENCVKIVAQLAVDPKVNIVMSLIDITKTIDYMAINNSQLAEAMKLLNVTYDDLYNALETIDLQKLIRNGLEKTFSITITQLMNNISYALNLEDILRIVSINEDLFYKINSRGNETTKADLLLSGNYSRQNVLQVSKLISLRDILDILSFKTIITNLGNVTDDGKLKTILHTLKISGDNLEKAMLNLSLTYDKLMAVDSVYNAINSISNHINSSPTLGTAIEDNVIVTRKNSKMFTHHNDSGSIKFIKDFTTIIATPLVSQIQTSFSLRLVSNDVYNSKNMTLFSSQIPFKMHIHIANDATNLNLTECFYISALDDSAPYMETFKYVQTIKYGKHVFLQIRQSNSTVYADGSPLICNKKLYGIAAGNNGTHIVFSTMLGEQDVNVAESGAPMSGVDSMPKIYILPLIISFTITKLFFS